MKRSLFGLGMLLVLLALGVAATGYMDGFYGAVRRELQAASVSAGAEDWPRAETALDRAEGQWQRSRKVGAALTDHEPLEEAEQLLTRLRVHLACRDSGAFRAECAHLIRALEAIEEAHAVNWWNILSGVPPVSVSGLGAGWSLMG